MDSWLALTVQTLALPLTVMTHLSEPIMRDPQTWPGRTKRPKNITEKTTESGPPWGTESADSSRP